MSRAELIEAAARAICSDGKPFKWGRLAPDSQQAYLGWAERALDAILAGLKEPSEEMVEEGAYMIPVGQGCEEGPLNLADARSCWQAMLATIAKEG